MSFVEVVGGGLANEIKSGVSLMLEDELLLRWDAGGGAIRDPDGLCDSWEFPGRGRDLLNCLSNLFESDSFIDDARDT